MKFLIVTALLASAAAPANARERLALVYPAQGDGVAQPAVSDVEDLLQAALARGRGGLTLGSEKVLEPKCGPAKTAPIACLSQLAGRGVVLRTTVRRAGRLLQVAIVAIDAAQHETGPATVAVDPVLQNAEPLVSALEALSGLLEAGTMAPPSPVAQKPAPVQAPLQTEPGPPIATQLQPPPAKPSPLEPRTAQPAPAKLPPANAQPAPRQAVVAERVPQAATGGLERAGKWTTAGGLALLAGSGALGFLGSRLSSRLSDKYAAHSLTASDHASYTVVQKYQTGTNALLITGGAVAATGLVLWIVGASDDEPAPTGGGGRF